MQSSFSGCIGLVLFFSVRWDHGGDSQFWAYMTITAGVLFCVVLVWLFTRNFAPMLDEESDDEATNA